MAIDFSFPAWLREQHSFADSLLKGAQVGSMIANARYRNQALAVQAEQANKEYALREKQLASQQRTSDLNFNLQSQLVEDQSEDKAAITSWIQERNKLPMEERLTMDLPALKLAQSYEIANKMLDNDRMTFERSLKGRTQAALALRLSKLPADYIQRFEMEPDWDSKMQILAEGEEASRTATLDLYQPREMTTSEGEKVLYNPKTGTFRFAPEAIGDEVVTRPITDETGKVIGHAMRSGEKWVRIPEESISKSKELLMRSELAEVNEQVKLMELTPEQAAQRRAEIEAKYTGTAPAAAPKSKAVPAVGEVRGGYKFLGGDPALPSSWEKLP